jgi:probable addiction module antidote protein
MTKIKVSELADFDAAEHIHTIEGAAAWLTVALEDEDPNFFLDALNALARSQGMAALARQSGITREALYKALRENSQPRFQTIHSVAKGLGMRVVFEPVSRELEVA